MFHIHLHLQFALMGEAWDLKESNAFFQIGKHWIGISPSLYKFINQKDTEVFVIQLNVENCFFCFYCFVFVSLGSRNI